MCYVGKATKIFIFLITVLFITGLVLGFSLLRRTIHPTSHKCSGDECSDSDPFPPPPVNFPITSTPDSGASNPSDLFPPPPPLSPSPPSSGLNSNVPPPPPVPALAPPPSESSGSKQAPPPPVTPVVVVAPPPGFNPVSSGKV